MPYKDAKKRKEYSKKHGARYSKDFRSKHPAYWKKFINSPNLAEREMLSRAKMRSKAKGLNFNLDLDDIIIPEFCPVFGIKLEKAKTKGPQDSSPSLDRIRPHLGYVKGNVWVISNKANIMKSNATVDEIEHLAQVLRRLEKKD